MTKDEFLADARAKLLSLHVPLDKPPGTPPYPDDSEAVATHEVGRLGAALDHLQAGPHTFYFRRPDGVTETIPFSVIVTPHPPGPPSVDGKIRVLAPVRSYEWGGPGPQVQQPPPTQPVMGPGAAEDV
jgi:hypothetical protein